MDNVDTVSHDDAEEKADTVKTSIEFPGDVWREAKKAAIDRGLTAKQFVIDIVRREVGMVLR